MDPLWTGPAVALVTLFDTDGSVAVDETAAHAARLRAYRPRGAAGLTATLADRYGTPTTHRLG
jgi:4-hydroxy-tetrahydrodipicolinate synthase